MAEEIRVRIAPSPTGRLHFADRRLRKNPSANQEE